MNEEKILTQLDYIKKQIDTILVILRGVEGDVNKPGLDTRVDRLEQSKKSHNWILGTIFTIGTLATATVLSAAIIRYLL